MLDMPRCPVYYKSDPATATEFLRDALKEC